MRREGGEEGRIGLTADKAMYRKECVRRGGGRRGGGWGRANSY